MQSFCIPSEISFLRLVIQNLPALLQHVDALGVFFEDSAMIFPLIQEPEQLKMHSIEQALLHAGRSKTVGRKYNLACFEAREMDLFDAAQSCQRIH